jgi:hypothetical protein
MRRIIGVLFIVAAVIVAIFQHYQRADVAPPQKSAPTTTTETPVPQSSSPASIALESLPVKGRAPKTGYTRTQFGDGWLLNGGCDMRNVILNRDLIGAVVNDRCKVLKGTLYDPYTGMTIEFLRGDATSDLVQIDHVVALSNAWQTGAQLLTTDERIALANDPLELLAVDGGANQSKADADAASWLPANKQFRCQYVARQIAVKQRYRLWVTEAEKTAMSRVLSTCPDQMLPATAPQS